MGTMAMTRNPLTTFSAGVRGIATHPEVNVNVATTISAITYFIYYASLMANGHCVPFFARPVVQYRNYIKVILLAVTGRTASNSTNSFLPAMISAFVPPRRRVLEDISINGASMSEIRLKESN